MNQKSVRRGQIHSVADTFVVYYIVVGEHNALREARCSDLIAYLQRHWGQCCQHIVLPETKL